jgi:hypothetical protein
MKRSEAIELKIKYGGYMSVDRIDALVRNSPTIRRMTLPIIPSNNAKCKEKQYKGITK